MRARTRVAVATAVITVLAGGSVAAAEASSSSPQAAPSSSAPSQPGKTDTSGTAAAGMQFFDVLASHFHVTSAQVDHALADAKRSMGERGLGRPDAAVFALVAKDLGISDAQARLLVLKVFGSSARPPGPGKQPSVQPGAPDPQIVQALAKVLGVGEAKASDVLKRLDPIYQRAGRTSESDPAFRAVAASLGLTPAQLSQDLVRMKESLRAVMPQPSDSPSPDGGAAASPSPSGKG